MKKIEIKNTSLKYILKVCKDNNLDTDTVKIKVETWNSLSDPDDVILKYFIRGKVMNEENTN